MLYFFVNGLFCMFNIGKFFVCFSWSGNIQLTPAYTTTVNIPGIGPAIAYCTATPTTALGNVFLLIYFHEKICHRSDFHCRRDIKTGKHSENPINAYRCHDELDLSERGQSLDTCIGSLGRWEKTVVYNAKFCNSSGNCLTHANHPTRCQFFTPNCFFYFQLSITEPLQPMKKNLKV